MNPLPGLADVQECSARVSTVLMNCLFCAEIRSKQDHTEDKELRQVVDASAELLDQTDV